MYYLTLTKYNNYHSFKVITIQIYINKICILTLKNSYYSHKLKKEALKKS